MSVSLTESLTFFLSRRGLNGAPVEPPTLQDLIDNFPKKVLLNFVSEEGASYPDIAEWTEIAPSLVQLVVACLTNINRRENSEELRLAISSLQEIENVFGFQDQSNITTLLEEVSNPSQSLTQQACAVARVYRAFIMAGDDVLRN